MAESKETFNVFVTGGSESVGLATVKALLRGGHRVVATAGDAEGALAIRQAGALPVYPDLRREGEVLSSLRMANAEVLVHAAPQILGGIPQANFNYESHADCLVASSRAVLRAARMQKLQKVISISFAYLYDAHHGDSASEGTQDMHGSDYQPMLRAEAAWLESGMNVTVLRAGYIYGGNSHATRALAQLVKSSRPLKSGSHQASWIHEDDLAAAIVTLIEAERNQSGAEILNAAADKPGSPNDFAISLSHALGLSAPSFASSGLMTRLWGETLRDRLLKREIVLNSSKISEEYGWQARYADVEQGLEATALVWRMQEAINPADFYDVYEDKAAAAIEALKSERALPAPAPAAAEQPAAKVVEKPAPVKASAPPPSDGPTPWNEDEAKREERRRKALERKAKRAARRAAGG